MPTLVSKRTGRGIARRSALLLLALVPPASLLAQGREYVVEHYAKSEHLIPMRDGARLFTAVYVPKDTSRTWPTLLKRTPYGVGPYGADQYADELGRSELFAREGFIFAHQDVRGPTMSEGEFVNVRPILAARAAGGAVDESTDAYDTIEWLVKNVAGNSGQVGVWGISYPGFYAACSAIGPPYQRA